MTTASASAERRARALYVALAAALLGVGFLTPFAPGLAIGLIAALVGSVLYVVVRPAVSDLLALLLSGAVVLTYGWANIGVTIGGIPLPVTEILLAVLIPTAILRMRSILEPGWTASFLLLFVGYATLRLVVDYPRWGVDAIRDYTLPLEMLVFFAGYEGVRTRGVEWAMSLWMGISIAVVSYGSLYPLREILVAFWTVGLRQEVALLHFAGLGAGLVAAFIYLIGVRRSGQLAVLATPLLLLGLFALLVRQERGIYLALPLALIVFALANRSLATGTLALVRGGVLTVLGLTMILAVTSAGILPNQGRLGELSPSFFRQHFSTIFGGEGVGQGSRDHRLEWIELVWSEVGESPTSVMTGVGLGPDLAGGFRTKADAGLIRKPHNDHLEILGRYGLAGLSAWILIFATAGWRVWASIPRLPPGSETRLFQAWVLSAMVTYLFFAGVQPYLAFPYGSIPLFTTLGMGVGVAVRYEGRQER